MKIISKFKDYYDYLSGIWGEDPLITYVRGGHVKLWGYYELEKVKVFIGGMLIEGLLYNENFYYGDDLIPFSKTPPAYLTVGGKLGGKYYLRSIESEYGIGHTRIQDLFMIDSNTLIVDGSIRRPSRSMFIQKAPIVDIHNTNEKESCPVFVRVGRDEFRNCSLKELGLSSILPAEEAYRLISDWLSLQRTKAEDRPDIRTNVQKVESHGFDNKTSFRPNIKD